MDNVVTALAAASSGGGGSVAGLIFPVLLIGLLGLLFFSQRRRARATAQVQSALRPGMNVMTTAGLYAEVQAVEDDAVHLEIAPGVVCRFARAAVARVLDPPMVEPMETEDAAGEHRPGDTPPPAAPAT